MDLYKQYDPVPLRFQHMAACVKRATLLRGRDAKSLTDAEKYDVAMSAGIQRDDGTLPPCAIRSRTDGGFDVLVMAENTGITSP